MSQIGTLRAQADGNTVSVPIFDTGDSGSSVFEMIKIQTATNTGFIPVVENSGDAAFPYLKVKTQNHGIVHVHNDSSLISIEWKTASDWDSAITETGTMHDALTNTDLSDNTVVTQSLPIGSTDNITSGLAGWWPLHTTSGKAADLSGNGNHGTHNGTLRGVAGKGGLQVTGFDPSSTPEVSLPSGIVSNTSDFSITAWVRPNKIKDARAVTFRGDTETYFAFSSGGEIRMRDSGGRIVLRTSYSADTWYHLAQTYDSSTSTLTGYVNATEEVTSSSGMGDDGSNNLIGSETTNASGWFHNGSVTDVRAYNRVLSQSEIQTLYNWGSTTGVTDPRLHDGSDSGAVARYALDGNVTDSWGSNDGTNNGVSFVSDSIRGQAGKFQEANGDSVTISPVPSSFPTGSESRTLSFWFNLSSYPTTDEDHMHPVNYGSVNTSEQFGAFIDRSNDELHFYGQGDDFGTGFFPKLESWYQTVVVYDGSVVEVFVNGNKIAEGNKSLSTGTSEFAVAKLSGSAKKYFDGLIDDVRIYKRVLEPYEIFQTYLWGTRGRDMRQMVAQAPL